ncbi:transglutaminaseTgpA domain-containing protein [Streptomyces sp. NPDC012510]|uniref:transglutaminase TgpA family protein n=1 Tax=Streptomyces sp. NPDC012510 TaxID=3364838 RepID=UPI0036E37D3E
MSGRARLALCAWAATVMAACALLPLVDPATWIVQAAFLLGVQTVVGALTRRVPLARPLTVAAQALVTLMMLTLIFARQQAVAGIVPGPEAFQRFATLLQTGAEDVGRYAIPAPLSDGIQLMIIGGVLVIGLLVDALAVTFRSAAPAGLPLLALYSVAAGLSDGAAWLWFVLASAGYLLLLLTESRDRLSQWGRVFGGAPHGPHAESTSGAVAPVRTGRRIGAVALGIALVVPLGMPSLDGGLLAGAGGGLGRGSGGGGTISAVNPVVSLRDSLNVDEDRQVLSYRTNTDNVQEMYLRIVSLDDFDGTSWKPTERSITEVPDEFGTPTGLGSDVKRSTITTRIVAAEDYEQDWLPMPYPVTKVDIDGDWRYEPVGRTLVGDHEQDTKGAQYTVESLIVRPTAKQLSEAPEPPPSLRREYTKVPSSLPSVVARTALEVTKGATNDYERAVKLQDWFAFSGEFTYDTEVRAGTGAEAIARFLREKEGFCVHFSFSMAAMARTLGIPARVAVGFTPGTPQTNGTMSVGLRDAHAWPELYFEGVGWTRFEPTPNRGTTPPYTVPEESGTSGLPDVPRPSQSASTAPSAEPSASESCTPQEAKLGACGTESAAAVAGSDDDDGSFWGLLFFSPWTLLILPGALLAVLIPLLPMLWRLRVRSKRLGAHEGALPKPALGSASAREVADEGGRTGGAQGSPGRATAYGRTEAAAAHALAAWQEVTDTAWDYGIAPDESQTPRKAAARIVRLGELEPSAAEAVHRVAAAVEQVLFAPRPQVPSGLARDAQQVGVGLRAHAGRRTKLRALLLPRSTVRVVWALSARWAATSDNLLARIPTWRPPWRRPSTSQNG